jgi:hypothetical protein
MVSIYNQQQQLAKRVLSFSLQRKITNCIPCPTVPHYNRIQWRRYLQTRLNVLLQLRGQCQQFKWKYINDYTRTLILGSQIYEIKKEICNIDKDKNYMPKSPHDVFF